MVKKGLYLEDCKSPLPSKFPYFTVALEGVFRNTGAEVKQVLAPPLLTTALCEDHVLSNVGHIGAIHQYCQIGRVVLLCPPYRGRN